MIGFILFAAIIAGMSSAYHFQEGNLGWGFGMLGLLAFNCFNFAVSIGG